VGVGESWPIAAPAAEAFVRGEIDATSLLSDLKATGRGMLESLEEGKGGLLARVRTSIECEATLAFDLAWADPAVASLPRGVARFKYEGVLVFAVDGGVPISLDLDGTGTVAPPDDGKAGGLEGTASGKVSASFSLEREAGEGVVLAFADRVGSLVEKVHDVALELDLEMGMEMPAEMSGGGADDQTFEMHMRVKNAGRESRSVLEADGGKAKKIRFEVLEGKTSIEIESPMIPDEAMGNQEEENPLVGETILVEGEGEESEAKIEGGGSDGDGQARQYTLRPEYDRLLPPESTVVKRGDRWTVDVSTILQDLVRQLGGGGGSQGNTIQDLLKGVHGQVDCTFEGVETLDGIRCGRIGFVADISADFDLGDILRAGMAAAEEEGIAAPMPEGLEGEGQLTIDVNGTLLAALDEERPLRLAAEGGLEFEADMALSMGDMGEMTISMNGSGDVTMNADFQSKEVDR
jgi:hypothetical protein